MLKILLYILAACLLAVPVAAWAYLVALGCAYGTNSSGCGVQLADFWDTDFLIVAALPWLLGIFCLFMVLK
jgi:hypothetical protein